MKLIKPYLTFLTCLIFHLTSFAQDNSSITIGHVDVIQSKILSQKREIIIHVPPITSQKDSFPLMIVFDGDALFTKTIGIVDHLSSDYGNNKCPKMIVVGIRHPNRMKDLFPGFNEDNPFENDKFADFLDKELIPYLDRNYPTKPFRLLVGHSVGGLRVAHSAVYNSSTFNAYIALDPSLGHDLNKWSFRTDSMIRKVNFSDKSMFVAMAQTMPVLTDTAIINKDNSGEARHMRAIMRFCNAFKLKNIQGMDFSWKYYPNERHAGVTFLGLYDGLQSIFAWYEFTNAQQLYDTALSASGAMAILEDHFKLVSRKMGYMFMPPESFLKGIVDNFWRKDQIEKAAAVAELNYKNNPKSESAINYLGYLRIEQKRLQDALVLFEKNTQNNPLSSNAWDSYGECLSLMNRMKEAINAYKKAIELDPNNRNAINMLKKITTE
ncbi:MAG: tetratricopeptide repeat protein [Flavobacteriales bacterium]|nr:tetratricopeptide repeat protein [Flavobacteriales bacterium]